MPPVVSELVEDPEPDAPYGVKGVGEPPASKPAAGPGECPGVARQIHYPGNSVPVTDLSTRHVAVPAWLQRIHYPGNSVPVTTVVGGQSRKPIDPLAVSYLMGLGLSPSEVTSWTSGACSQEFKAASCYAMLETSAVVSTQASRSIGFQWADAGIGAGFAVGVLLLLGGTAAVRDFTARSPTSDSARVRRFEEGCDALGLERSGRGSSGPPPTCDGQVRLEQPVRGGTSGHTATVATASAEASPRCANGW